MNGGLRHCREISSTTYTGGAHLAFKVFIDCRFLRCNVASVDMEEEAAKAHRPSHPKGAEVRKADVLVGRRVNAF